MIDGSMKSWKPACRSQPRRRSGFSCHVGLKCLHGDRQNVNCSHRRKRKRERGAPHPQCDGVWGLDDAMEIDIWGVSGRGQERLWVTSPRPRSRRSVGVLITLNVQTILPMLTFPTSLLCFGISEPWKGLYKLQREHEGEHEVKVSGLRVPLNL